MVLCSSAGLISLSLAIVRDGLRRSHQVDFDDKLEFGRQHDREVRGLVTVVKPFGTRARSSNWLKMILPCLGRRHQWG